MTELRQKHSIMVEHEPGLLLNVDDVIIAWWWTTKTILKRIQALVKNELDQILRAAKSDRFLNAQCRSMKRSGREGGRERGERELNPMLRVNSVKSS